MVFISYCIVYCIAYCIAYWSLDNCLFINIVIDSLWPSVGITIDTILFLFFLILIIVDQIIASSTLEIGTTSPSLRAVGEVGVPLRIID